MSCGAECILEMMEFSAMDQLRGNPASLKAAGGCGCCGGGDNFKPSYNLDSSSNKYGVGNSKQGYILSSNYFETPAKISNYIAMVNQPYNKMAAYQIKAVNVQKPMLYQEQMPRMEQRNIAQSEIDNLEAMILAAKAKEVNAWIQ